MIKVYVAHPMEKSMTNIVNKLNRITNMMDCKVKFLLPEAFSPNIEADQDELKRHLIGKQIFMHNKILMQGANLIVADISKTSAGCRDSGVMWELGYMYSLGTPSIVLDDSHWTSNIMIEQSTDFYVRNQEELEEKFREVLNTLCATQERKVAL